MVSVAKQVEDHQNGVSIVGNGYLYVYCSNESNKDMFFDNLQVIHTHGPLTEETHYYPFGLTMTGISSKAMSFGGAANKRGFNGGNEMQNKEFSDGSGLELYDAVHRMYDPQLGRFGQLDPLADVTAAISPFAFGGNNPILRNDPLGLRDTAINESNPNVLPQVYLYSKRHVAPPPINWLGRGSASASEHEEQQANQSMFWHRLNNGLSLTQKGDRGSYLASLPMYKHWNEEDKNYRAMQAWAVGILATPVALSTISPAALVASLRLKAGLNLTAAAVDATVQLTTKKPGDFNIVSPLVLGSIGPESSAIGAAFAGSTTSTIINVSFNSVLGNDQIFNNPFSAANAQTIMLNTTGGAVGGFLGKNFSSDLPLGHYYGDFLGNSIGSFTGSVVDESSKK